METVRINGTLFNIQDSFSINFNNFETLNNAEIKLELNNKIKFTYFDEIIIDKYYFYLVDYELITIRSGKYLYKMQVVNPSIQLQNIFLPNRAVEKGTDLLGLIRGYINIYKNDLIISDNLFNLINGAKTLQNTWNEPTLFEVFNTLLQPFNAVITMTNFNTLDYIKLDKRGDSIDNLYIKDIVYKTDYVNHATEFKSQLKNAVSDNFLEETIFLTTPNEPVINDNNFIGLLSHPVEKIKQVIVFYFGYVDGTGKTLSKNITNMFIERTIYDTLKPSNSAGTVPSNGYKRNHLWYQTGSNILGGLDYDDKTWLPVINISKPSYDYWGFKDDGVTFSDGIRSVALQVRYEAQLNDVAVNMKKNALNTGNKTMLVNQSEPFLDLDAFATKQTLDLERAGEMSIDIYGEGTPPDLMDYHEDYNIYSLNVVYEKNKTSWFAEAKRGFSYSDLRTAISSEKRFTSIESQDKAFLSNHVEIHNFEFSEIEKPVKNEYKEIIKYLLFKEYIDKAFLYSEIAEKSFVFSPLLEKYGNSLISFFKFKDNYSAGFIRTDVNTQIETPYVNNKGEFSIINNYLIKEELAAFIFLNNDNDPIKTRKQILELPAVFDSDLKNAIVNKPKVYSSINLLRNKTNREITAETQQFNLLSNEKFIVWDDYFKDIGWGVDNPIFNKDNYRIFINMSDKEITKIDYNFLTTQVEPRFWNINDNNFEFTFSADITGLLIKRKVDNKPILAYNGSKKKIYIIDSYKRSKNDYGDYGIPPIYVDIEASVNASATFNSYQSIATSFTATSYINSELNYNYWQNYLNVSVNASYDIVSSQSVGTKIEGLATISGTIDDTALKSVKILFFSQGVIYSTITAHVGDVVYYPSTPARDGYKFVGWYTNTTGGSEVSNPFIAPNNDVSYYARWEATSTTPKWQYLGSSSSMFCISVGYNPIGMACSTEGSKMTVSGEDIGSGEGCYELICKL